MMKVSDGYGPHIQMMEHDIKATNPGFATKNMAYTENCQRCVSAYELRRRGYDVIAKPRLAEREDFLLYMESQWGWPAVYENYKLEYCGSRYGYLAKQNVINRMKGYGDGSRAIVRINWLLRDKGHVFMAENHESEIYFIDPQTGGIDVSWYFDYAEPFSVVLMRTDNLEFTDLIGFCCE